MFHKEGYNYKTIEDVEIVAGEIVELNVDLGMPVPVGIETNSVFERFEMYPNPFESNITIDYQVVNAENRPTKLSVFNSIGNLVEELELSSVNGTISIGNKLPSGIYFVKINNGSQFSTTKRIIKL